MQRRAFAAVARGRGHGVVQQQPHDGHAAAPRRHVQRRVLPLVRLADGRAVRHQHLHHLRQPQPARLVQRGPVVVAVAERRVGAALEQQRGEAHVVGEHREVQRRVRLYTRPTPGSVNGVRESVIHGTVPIQAHVFLGRDPRFHSN